MINFKLISCLIIIKLKILYAMLGPHMENEFCYLLMLFFLDISNLRFIDVKFNFAFVSFSASD